MIDNFSVARRVISLLLVSSMVSSSLSPVFAGVDDDNPETPKSITATSVTTTSYFDIAEREGGLYEGLKHWEGKLVQAKASRGKHRNQTKRINHAANMVEGVRDVLKTLSTQKRKLAGAAVFSQSPITNLIFGEQEGWGRMNLTAYERQRAKLVSKSWHRAVNRAEKDSGRFRLEPLHLGSFRKGENLAQRYAHLVIEGYIQKTYEGESFEEPAFLNDTETRLLTRSPCLQSVDLRVRDFRAVEMLLLNMNPSTELHVEMDQPFGEPTALRLNDASFSGFMTWMRCMTSMTCYPAHSSRPENPSPKAPDYDPKGAESWLDFKARLRAWGEGRMGEILNPQSRAENSSQFQPPKPRRGLRELTSLALSFQSAVHAVDFLEELYLQLDLVNKWREPPRLQKIVLFINQYVSDFSSELDNFGLLAHRSAQVAPEVLGQLTALKAKFEPRLQVFTKNDVFDGVWGNLTGDTMPSFSVASILPVVMPVLKQCSGVGYRVEFLKVLSCVRPSTLHAVLSLMRKSVFLSPSFLDSSEGIYVQPETISAVAELMPSYRSSALKGVDVVFPKIDFPVSYRYRWIDQVRHCILFFGLISPPDHGRVATHLMRLFSYDGGFSQEGSKPIKKTIREIPSVDRTDVICHAVPCFSGGARVVQKVELLRIFQTIPKSERPDIRERALKYDVVDSERLFIIKTLATMSRETRDQIDAFVERESEWESENYSDYKLSYPLDRFIAASSGIPVEKWESYARMIRDDHLGFNYLYANCSVGSPKELQLLCRLTYDQDEELKRIKDSLPPLRYAYVYTCVSNWTSDLEKLFKEYRADVHESVREDIIKGLLTVVPSKRSPVLSRLQQIYEEEQKITEKVYSVEKRDIYGDVDRTWGIYDQRLGIKPRTGIKAHLVPLMKVLEDYTDEEFKMARPLVQGYVNELELVNVSQPRRGSPNKIYAQSPESRYAPIFAGLRKVDQGDWKELFDTLAKSERFGFSPCDFFKVAIYPEAAHWRENLCEFVRQGERRLSVLLNVGV